MSDPISFTAKSARFDLPFLFAGQAQKEFFVNQGLALTDCLLHSAVEGSRSTPPTDPIDGECWIVDSNPEGDWFGYEDAMACRQAGTWIFVTPREGMQVFDHEAGQQIRFNNGWKRAAEPAIPSGGTVVDLEARTALNNLVETLRIAGILPFQ
ncbi:DUF2793 domain-containing protein [Altererythrobacter sp. ZODW24]|uniref:DUF2793 domain-containing protein n=1 Tax=Altererythrobacter sp. ZODW24 TaxID=2185142 RepID=UPI000DF765D7|nr:DUF2793 domain-containing protein [Altererythrobacter sp. ZODW24]